MASSSTGFRDPAGVGTPGATIPGGASLTLLVASLSWAGNCYDNAALESFWGKLKSERVHRHDFATR